MLTNDGLNHFSQVAESYVGDDNVPGFVALVASGDQVHAEAHGHLSIGGAPVRRDSQFRIASTTKPITGAATMALVEEGLIALDDPVDRWIPELADLKVLRNPDGALDDVVPADRAITVRDLLTFTFGFGMVIEMFAAPRPWPVVAASDELHLGTIGEPHPDIQPEPDTWIKGLGSLPLIAQPGERWLYSTGASVLGVLAKRVTGQKFSEVLRTRIFEPLEMKDTDFYAKDISRLATAYFPAESGHSVWDRPEGEWSHAPAFEDGAAGLVSTVDDLYSFARAMKRGGEPILSAASVTAMTTDHLTPLQRTRDGAGFLQEVSWGFCQSVVIEGPRAGSFGWDGGLGTSWHVDPVRDLIVIVLTQILFGSPQTPTIHAGLRDAAYQAIA